jgi:hypothetical protein
MQNQKGMTVVGMLMAMVVVVLALIVVMRIVPVVIQHYSIVNAIESLSETPSTSMTGDPVEDITTLKANLNKRFDINGLEYLKENELVISPDGENKYKVTLKYQVTRPLAFNVSLLFSFDRTIKLVVKSEI